jgi:hypothetical protein
MFRRGRTYNTCSVLSIVVFLFILFYNINFVFGEEWIGEGFVPDTKSFGENTWRLNANCDNSATMEAYIKGPCFVEFRWRKSTSYGSAFEFSLIIEKIKTKLICPSLDEWNYGSIYIPDDNVHRMIWVYKKKLPAERYCDMDSSAWIKDIAMSSKSLLNFEPFIHANLSGTVTSPFNRPISTNSSSYYINISRAFINVSNLIEKSSSEENKTSNESKYSQIVITPIWPEENDNLPSYVPIKFDFIPLNSAKIPICTLFIDDKEIYERNKSRYIINMQHNVFNHTLNETGIHNWRVKCCDCEGKCNSSNNIYFFIKSNAKNMTTYVNKNNFDLGRFRYAKIQDAINNVTEGGTVQIENGTYEEQLEISKPLTIKGSKESMINLKGRSDAAIKIKSSNVYIEGFTIANCVIGIMADSSENIASNCLENISLFNNTIYDVTNAFYLLNCNNTNVAYNNIYECKDKPYGLDSMRISDAIYLTNCSNYNIYNNTINKIAFVSSKSIRKINCCIHLFDCGEALHVLNNELYNSTYGIGFTDAKVVIDEQKLMENNFIYSNTPIGRNIPA